MLLEPPPNLPPWRPRDWLALARLGARVMRMRPAQLGQLVRMFSGSARDVLDGWFESDELKVGAGDRRRDRRPTAGRDARHGVRAAAPRDGRRRRRPRAVGLRARRHGRADARRSRQSARAAGAEIRTDAEVDRIVVRDGRARRRRAGATASELPGARASSRTPIRSGRSCGWSAASSCRPSSSAQVEGYRCEGASFKMNLALGELPELSRAARARRSGRSTAARRTSARAWTTSSAPGTRPSTARPSREPLLEITIPTAYDPSLAPAGQARHVDLCPVRAVPAARRAVGRRERERVRRPRASTCSASTRRTSAARSSTSHALSPLDLEREYGLTGGNIFHGELRLDQLFALRPVAGWARYATPIRGLYLCGSGTHPGGGVTGAPGHNAARADLALGAAMT